jgi:hypothetical protein
LNPWDHLLLRWAAADGWTASADYKGMHLLTKNADDAKNGLQLLGQFDKIHW